MPGLHLLPVPSQLSGRSRHSTIGSRCIAASKPTLVSTAICPASTGPVQLRGYCWSGLYRSDNCRASFPSGAWPALCFLRVIALFFSKLILLLIYLNHWESIFVCTRLKIQLREYQRQIQQNSTKPQRKKLIKFRRTCFPSSWTTAVWKTRPFSSTISDWMLDFALSIPHYFVLFEPQFSIFCLKFFLHFGYQKCFFFINCLISIFSSTFYK